jgi:hypothetical protein
MEVKAALLCIDCHVSTPDRTAAPTSYPEAAHVHTLTCEVFGVLFMTSSRARIVGSFSNVLFQGAARSRNRNLGIGAIWIVCCPEPRSDFAPRDPSNEPVLEGCENFAALHPLYESLRGFR